MAESSDGRFVSDGSFPRYPIYYGTAEGVYRTVTGSYEEAGLFGYCSAGGTLSASVIHTFEEGTHRIYTDSIGILPVYEVVPNTAVPSNTYNITTRPTSITGGNYGIVGDNGQITKVEDNSTIVNETNNTYYNPATGATVPIVNWSYDYSDRSYKVTLDGGKTSTVTYGDENISIVETTINESGDTITNNYTIYYLIDGSGSQTPVDPPSACDHSVDFLFHTQKYGRV